MQPHAPVIDAVTPGGARASAKGCGERIMLVQHIILKRRSLSVFDAVDLPLHELVGQYILSTHANYSGRLCGGRCRVSKRNTQAKLEKERPRRPIQTKNDSGASHELVSEATTLATATSGAGSSAINECTDWLVLFELADDTDAFRGSERGEESRVGSIAGIDARMGSPCGSLGVFAARLTGSVLSWSTREPRWGLRAYFDSRLGKGATGSASSGMDWVGGGSGHVNLAGVTGRSYWERFLRTGGF
jgi:hypothetical protein